jgi:hypothetical protein
MNIALNNLPRWAIVAVVSRTARHLQSAVCRRFIDECRIINDAISIVESSARHARVEPVVRQAAIAARQIADAIKTDRPNASKAAICAAKACELTALSGDELIQAARECIEFAIAASAENGCLLGADLAETARIAEQMRSDDPAPEQMLNFAHQQAIHEAGHVVLARIRGIPYEWARLVYCPAVAPAQSREDFDDDICIDECRRYQLFFAAGVAAEKAFGINRGWGSEDDRKKHAGFGAGDFDKDAVEVCGIPKFSRTVVLEVAELLEKSDPVWSEVGYGKFEPVFQRHGIKENLHWCDPGCGTCAKASQ